jgi:hypothetical protein
MKQNNQDLVQIKMLEIRKMQKKNKINWIKKKERRGEE